MPRLKITLAYIGTAYHGWQTQRRTGLPELPTIQATVEKAVASIIGMPVHVCGSGRTDSGVHADGQVAHVDIPESKIKLNWQLALNTILPPDIRIINWEYVDSSFHAQHDVREKVYSYRLWLNRYYTPPKLYPFVWSCGEIDLSSMDKASSYLVGAHDFSSLQNRGTYLLSTIRKVSAIYRVPNELIYNEQYEVIWFFKANGFLKQMVRNMMGLLVSVGKGKLFPEQVPEVLNAKKRCHNSPTAPAQGLTLTQVFYP